MFVSIIIKLIINLISW